MHACPVASNFSSYIACTCLRLYTGKTLAEFSSDPFDAACPAPPGLWPVGFCSASCAIQGPAGNDKDNEFSGLIIIGDRDQDRKRARVTEREREREGERERARGRAAAAAAENYCTVLPHSYAASRIYAFSHSPPNPYLVLPVKSSCWYECIPS